MSTFRLPLGSGFGALARVATLCLAVSACGAPSTPAENDLFREASLALEDESYTTAVTNYKKLLEEYPFSDKAEIVSINIAYAYYLKGEYAQAVASFNDFERLYPTSPLLPFVSYTVGICWLDQAKAGDRDPSASSQALLQFTRVANEFPGSLYADLAAFRQQQARENLAAHELVVGDYYNQRKNLSAAASRYAYVVQQYPTTENATRAAQKLALVQVAILAQPHETATQEADDKSGAPMIADDRDSAADINVVNIDPVDDVNFP